MILCVPNTTELQFHVSPTQHNCNSITIKSWGGGGKLERCNDVFSSHFQKLVGVISNRVGTNINFQEDTIEIVRV